jgi:hypothetical protein
VPIINTVIALRIINSSAIRELEYPNRKELFGPLGNNRSHTAENTPKTI